MKTTKLLMLTTLLTVAFNTQAQIATKVDKDYGKSPAWAPKAPVKTQYYYLPDIQTYYDVPAKRYIYQKDGNWVRTSSLPIRYKGYDLYKGQTVYLTDYKGKTPYTYYKKHKVKYAGKPWKANGHDNGNHYGQLKNKNKGKGHGHVKHEKGDDHGKGHGIGDDHGKDHGNGKGNGKK